MEKDARRLLKLAAKNNAEWCNIVCEANGLKTKFEDDIWYSISNVPANYPNIITLNPDVTLERIELITGQIPGSVSIKDSFNTLDLSKFSFRKLFEGYWIFAEKLVKLSSFQLLNNLNQLQEWETASGSTPKIFNYAILKNATVKFVAFYDRSKIVAGGILNRSESVIGLSNFFCNTDQAAAYHLACIAAGQTIFGSLPVVGYQKKHGFESLDIPGFKKLGMLAVWLRH